MKLATLRSADVRHRDGHLVVVSRDLSRMLSAETVAPTVQAALDDWARLEAPLRALAARLESGEGQQFYPRECLSPLPRAFQWADGSAYVNHVELVRKARNAPMPASFWTDPL
ncbi:MAG: hypothetical protein FJ178_08370, partial [Gammaproteobacteria bacterium]|nr:hypothetical protein [Gammaproteobacteria bacterium]